MNRIIASPEPSARGIALLGLLLCLGITATACSRGPVIDVSVTTADGSPAAGTLVVFDSDFRAGYSFALRMNARGRFTLRQADGYGNYQVSVHGPRPDAAESAPGGPPQDVYLGVNSAVTLPPSGRVQLDFVIPATGRVEVSVRDEDENPLIQTEIVLFHQTASGAELIVAQGPTGYDGVVVFDRVPAGDYLRKELTFPHYQPAREETVNVVAGTTTVHLIRMTYPPHIRGRAWNVFGDPVAPNVVVRRGGHVRIAKWESRPDGQFVIHDLPESATYNLSFHDDFHGRQEIHGVAVGDRDLEVVFPAGGLEFAVTDSDTGNSINNVRFDFRRATWFGNNLIGQPLQREFNRTSPKGQYRINIEPSDHYLIYFHAEGYVSRIVGPLALRDGEVHGPVIVAMTPAVRLRGRMLDGTRNQPIAGAQVTLEDLETGSRAADYVFNSRTATNEQGRFAFTDLPKGAYLLSLNPAANETAYVPFPGREIRLDGDLDLGDILIQHAGRIKGRVVNYDNTPAAGVTVEVRLTTDDNPDRAVTVTTTTNPEGEFEVGRLPHGTATLTALFGGTGKAAQHHAHPETFTVDHARANSIAIQLPPPLRVAVQLDWDGQPAAARNLNLTPLQPGLPPSPPFSMPESATETHQETGVIAPGEYLLEGEMGNGSLTRWMPLRERIAIHGPLTRIHLDARSDAIRAEVADREGQPVSRAEVVLLQVGSSGGSGVEEMRTLDRRPTSGSGRVDLPALLERDYLLRVQRDGYETKYVEVRTRDRLAPVRIVLDRAE